MANGRLTWWLMILFSSISLAVGGALWGTLSARVVTLEADQKVVTATQGKQAGDVRVIKEQVEQIRREQQDAKERMKEIDQKIDRLLRRP